MLLGQPRGLGPAAAWTLGPGAAPAAMATRPVQARQLLPCPPSQGHSCRAPGRVHLLCGTGVLRCGGAELAGNLAGCGRPRQAPQPRRACPPPRPPRALCSAGCHGDAVETPGIQDPQKRSHLVTLGSQPCNPRGQKCTEGAPTSFRPAAVTQGGGGAPQQTAPRRLSHVPQSQPPTARGGPGLRNVTVMVGASRRHPLGDSTGPWQDSQPDRPLGLTLNARAPGEPGPGVQPPAERRAGALLQGQR